MQQAVAAMQVDPGKRNVLITHQNVTNSGVNRRSDSETISIGGLDNIDRTVFDIFDYVALGHLHSPQQIGKPEIRYCGTPVIYSMSEADDQKSVTVVELGEKESFRSVNCPCTSFMRGTILRVHLMKP